MDPKKQGVVKAFLVKIAKCVGICPHTMLAKSTFPEGTWMRCGLCGRVQHATIDDVAHYYAAGWPRCHGRAMVASAEKITVTGMN